MEIFQERRHVAPSKAQPAQDVLSHSVRVVNRTIGLRIEHDHAQRITMLAAHQVGDGGFIVGPIDVDLGERRAGRP